MKSRLKNIIRYQVASVIDKSSYVRKYAIQFEDMYWSNIFGKISDQVFDGLYGAYDVYIGHDLYSLSAARKLSEKNNAPLVLDLSQTEPVNNRLSSDSTTQSIVSKNYFRRELEQALDLSAHTFVNSRHMQNKIDKVENISILPSVPMKFQASSDNDFESLRSKLKIKHKKNLIAYSGSFATIVNSQAILDFLQINSRKYHLIVFGNKHEIQSQLEKDGFQKSTIKNISFAETSSYQEYVTNLSECDLALLKSDYSEQMSLPETLFEYIHGEVPILFDASNTELLHLNEVSQFGLSGDLSNPDDLLEKAKELTLKAPNFKKASEYFSWENFGKEFVERINNLLPKKKKLKKICFLVRDSLKQNRRIYRQIKSLVSEIPDLEIDVLSYSNRGFRNTRAPERVRYISVHDFSSGSLPRQFVKKRNVNRPRQISEFAYDKNGLLHNGKTSDRVQVWRQNSRLTNTKKSISDYYKFSERLFNFAASSVVSTKNVSRFDAIIAHEMFSLNAAIAVANDKGNKPLLIYDNVEYPDVLGRNIGTQLSLLKESDASLLNYMHVLHSNEMDHIFATSDGQQQKLEEMGVTVPCELLRNYHAADQWGKHPENTTGKSLSKMLEIPDNKIIVLHANNIYGGAGFDLVLEAMLLLPKKYVLVCLGRSYNEEDEIKAFISDNELQDRVYFSDPVPSQELVGISSTADISIIPLPDTHPNYKTCLPNRLFDSYGARLPVVAMSRTAIGRHVAANKLGEVVKKKTPEEMAAKIQSAWKNSKLYKKNISKFCEKNNWDKEYSKVIKLLNSKEAKRVLLLANKKIETNARIYRMTKSMLEAGIEVTVVANTFPNPDLQIEGIRYINSNEVQF